MKWFAIILAFALLVLPVTASAAEVTESTESTGEVSALVVESGDLSDLTYYDISCSLGEIRIYLPDGYDSSTLQLIDGQLVSTNNSTIYPYCPEFPDYTFQASRWSPLQYRTSSSNYTWVELTDVVINSTADQTVAFPQIYIFLLLSILFSLVIRRSAHD